MLDGVSVSTAVRDQMPNDHVAAVVLAAGKGTRMKSVLPKVLHPLAGRPLILHLLDTVHTVGVERAVVVVGPEGAHVAQAVAPALHAVQTGRASCRERVWRYGTRWGGAVHYKKN